MHPADGALLLLAADVAFDAPFAKLVVASNYHNWLLHEIEANRAPAHFEESVESLSAEPLFICGFGLGRDLDAGLSHLLVNI